MFKTITIFDLDGTIIDSDHRQLRDPVSGSLDVKHWRENSSREKIFQDSLLPLANLWKDIVKNTDELIVICTARIMSLDDFDFLDLHGLDHHVIFSRLFEDGIYDHDLKFIQLGRFLSAFNGIPVRMYDDNDKVREIISTLGVQCYDPT